MTLNAITITLCLIIIGGAMWAYHYIKSTDSVSLPQRRQWIEQLPSVVSTSGVFGTFVGITIGLVDFNTADLDASIPTLLDGLKMAFFTSLCGMFCSVLLNRVVSGKLGKADRESAQERAARLVVEALRENREAAASAMTQLREAVSDDKTLCEILDELRQTKDVIEEVKGVSDSLREDIHALSEAVTIELTRIRAVALTASGSVAALDNNVAAIRESVTALTDSTAAIDEKLEEKL